MNDHDRALGPGREPDPNPAPARAGFTAPSVPPDPPAGHDADLTGAPGPAGPPGPADLEELAGLVYDRISEQISQRPDAAGEMPSVEEAVALRERAPELYDLWLRIAQERAATGNYVQRAPYEVPERLAQSGRPRALSSLVVVLAFCGYLAWLGGPGPYIAGLIALFDLIAMLGLFFGLRPDHLSDPRRSSRKRLSALRLAAKHTPAAPAYTEGPVETGPSRRRPGKTCRFSPGGDSPLRVTDPALRPRAAGSATSPSSLLRQ